MFLHEGSDVLVSSIECVTNLTHLKTIGNVLIPVHSIVTIPTKQTGKYDAITPCIVEVEIEEIVCLQNAQLVLLPTVHLKDEVEQEQFH